MGRRTTWTPECYTLLKRFGYTYEPVERRIPGGPGGPYTVTKDFGGFADILAWRPVSVREIISELEGFVFTGVLAIQACSHSTLAAHITKVTQGLPSEKLASFLLAGNRFEVWAFPEPRKKKRYVLTWITDSAGRRRQVRQLDMRSTRITFDNGQFWSEPTTELGCFGYQHRDAT
jgi:hypothetical protein